MILCVWDSCPLNACNWSRLLTFTFSSPSPPLCHTLCMCPTSVYLFCVSYIRDRLPVGRLWWCVFFSLGCAILRRSDPHSKRHLTQGDKDGEIWSLFLFTGGLKVTCEYMAQQEGVLCEEVLLLSETNEDVCVKVKVHARVMGEATLPVIRWWSHFAVPIPIATHYSLQMTFCHLFFDCWRSESVHTRLIFRLFSMCT